MNTKFSFTKGIRIVTVLAGLALAAYGGQAALAKSADRLPQAHTPEVVHTSGADLVAQAAAGQKPEIKLPALPAPAEDRSGASREAQPADDKGGLNPTPEIVGAEAGDDKGIIQAEAGDDKGVGETQLGDDKGTGEVELGDDKGAGEAEPGDDRGLNEVEDNAAGVEFRGTLSAINGDVLTINGMTVTISATTEVKGTLKVGDMVKVEGFRATDNTVQAQEIKIVSQTSDDSLNSKPATSTEDKSVSSTGSSNSGSQGSDNPAPDDHGGGNGGGGGGNSGGGGGGGADDPNGHH